MTEQFANYSLQTLSVAAGAADATITVSSGASLPAVGTFRLLIEGEILLATARAGNVVTVTRGAEGTTAAAHAQGTPVVPIVTAGAMQEFAKQPKWLTAFDIDFTAGSVPTTFGADGPVAYAGYTWTKVNSANEVVSASATPGVGLNFQPVAATDYNGATRTLPLLWLPFSQIFPSATFPEFQWDTQLRLWVAVGTDNPAAIYDNETFGFDSNSTSFGMVVNRGFGTVGPQGSQALLNFTGATNANNFVSDSFALGAGNKTMVVEIDSVASVRSRTYLGAGLAAGAPFPDLDTLTPSILDLRGQAPNVAATQVFGATGITDPRTLGIFLGAHRSGSGTALSVNYLRARLDYKN